MLSFSQFIIEETSNPDGKLRVGIRHISHSNPNAPVITKPVKNAHEMLHSLIGTGEIKGSLTEKTDGAAFEMRVKKNEQTGEHEFHTRTSRSGWTGSGGYQAAARAKGHTDMSISKRFDDLHEHLRDNPNLQRYLKEHAKKNGGEARMSGEAMYHPMGTEHPDGEHVTYVGTKYSKKKLGGKMGAFIMHTAINPQHNPKVLPRLNNKNIHFHHDHSGEVNIPVKEEAARLATINPEGIKTQKDPRHEELREIAKRVDKKTRAYIGKRKPKWGPETEGHVIHAGIKVKIVDKGFAENKKKMENETGKFK